MSKAKVLYVDDEEINLQLFSVILKDRFEILTAANGPKGLEVLKEHQDIDVVISDMSMPMMTGIEFIEAAQEVNDQIAYYILTGYEITKEIKEALSNNLIKKYFQKPFDLNELGDQITPES